MRNWIAYANEANTVNNDSPISAVLFQKLDSSLTPVSLALCPDHKIIRGGAGKRKEWNAAGIFCRVQSIFQPATCNLKIYQKCSNSLKLLLFYYCSCSCYYFRACSNVSVVCSIVLSRGIKPFMWDLKKAATWSKYTCWWNVIRSSNLKLAMQLYLLPQNKLGITFYSRSQKTENLI